MQAIIRISITNHMGKKKKYSMQLLLHVKSDLPHLNRLIKTIKTKPFMSYPILVSHSYPTIDSGFASAIAFDKPKSRLFKYPARGEAFHSSLTATVQFDIKSELLAPTEHCCTQWGDRLSSLLCVLSCCLFGLCCEYKQPATNGLVKPLSSCCLLCQIALMWWRFAQ